MNGNISNNLELTEEEQRLSEIDPLNNSADLDLLCEYVVKNLKDRFQFQETELAQLLPPGELPDLVKGTVENFKGDLRHRGMFVSFWIAHLLSERKKASKSLDANS